MLLRLHRTLLERAFQILLSFLPASITSWIQDKLPEWCLPENIVFKIQKDDWAEEFERERAIYEQLRPLQGVVIPHCYGCVNYDGKRALILSNIGGACLATPAGAVLAEKDLKPLLSQALTALAQMGVAHDDTKLDNFHLVTNDGKDKIMIVDLEIVDTSPSEDNYAFATFSNVSHMIGLYRMHLDCLQHDGYLLPKRPLNA